MTHIEYLVEQSLISDKIRELKEQLILSKRVYIENHCPVKVGWTVENNSRTLRIRVEKIDPIGTVLPEIPAWELFGTVINLDGSISKKHNHYHSFTVLDERDFTVIGKGE